MKTFDRSFLHNSFKQAAENQQTQLGLWLETTSPIVAEIAAGSGYDFYIIDAEHAPNTLQTILGQVQALGAYPSAQPIVRIMDHNRSYIKQLLDLGIQNIIVPMVETKEQAEHIAASMYYAPRGKRGFGAPAVRAGRWLRLPEYPLHAEQELAVFAQIESRQGFENADDIINANGITGIFLGPADMAMDMGYTGDFSGEEMQSKIKTLIEKTRKAGKPVGTIAGSPEEAKRYLEWGASFVAVGADTVLYAAALDNNLEAFKAVLA